MLLLIDPSNQANLVSGNFAVLIDVRKLNID
jgi:hypothetical protein